MHPRDVVASVPFFVDVLDFSQLDRLGDRLAEPREFGRGALLMRQGEIGHSMFIVAEGKVAISIHSPSGEQHVATLGAGDVVGEMSLLTGARRSATVTAAKRVAAVEIPKAAIEGLIVETPGLIGRFAEMMEQRHAELGRIHDDAGRWNNLGLSRDEIVARMTAYFAG
ncbi:MAG: cyclic nucleotide-binding domain-containing protein [Rhizobiales bacterium]|nr:cyclic nucleotide-binding domain-containing protein [Hyphomicrobiales bacterium]